MTDTQIHEHETTNFKNLTIHAGSGVALYWLIDKVMSSETSYRDYIAVGLAGGAGITVVAPILENLLEGRDLLSGVKFSTDLIKTMAIDAGLSAAIFYAIRWVLPDVDSSLLYKYVGVAASVIGADMVGPWVMKKF